MIYDAAGSVEGGTGWYLVVGGTGSVRGGPGWCLVILGQYGAVVVGTWWHWASIGWYWLIYDGTGSVQGGAGR